MILLVGLLSDEVLAYVCTRMLQREIEFLVLDPRHDGEVVDLTWSISDGAVEGSVRCGSTRVPLEDVRSVYLREMGVPDRSQPGNGSEEARCAARAEWVSTLAAFAETAPCLVVNRPSAIGTNASKPYQQQIIARHGFRVPRTLVTTVPEEAARFYEACRGRVIYKSVSYQRSIVVRMTPADLERLDQVRRCPTQFQEYVPGVDIRVHVVGRRVFATEIHTGAIDYRYARREGAAREMRAVELPAGIAERCLRLAEGLGMPLAGIDLRRSPDGEYCCFEVNPSPAFTFYQGHTGQRIGDALIDLLVEPQRAQRAQRGEPFDAG